MALVGETGCGKSVVAHAIMRLLPSESRVKGIVKFRGKKSARTERKRNDRDQRKGDRDHFPESVPCP
ncbi:ATP-binding cassette domain-containing protein [Methanosarcina horonobensis]|uniref:ATP-binding cassette domain-containing protein n=1 Tax=Methanosarcina horonobensis TaxID=418008 RepID=UPI0022B8FEB1|nr:ATP-binding cassette domain-containing protein [Methanosarcina horonobensis]